MPCDGEVMLAYAMNGEDLPWLNGYPVRLVVPGYYGTYWVKHLNEITVLDKVFDGFWMKTAYRIPDQRLRLRRTRHSTGFHRADQSLQRPLVHHQPRRRRDGDRPMRMLHCAASPLMAATGSAMWLFPPMGEVMDGRTLGESLGKYSFREWRAAFRLPGANIPSCEGGQSHRPVPAP